MTPTTTFLKTAYGRMRSRAVGRGRDGVPQVVLVQGMAVADYLLPGLRSLGEWTRAHLVELPGFGGSSEPPHPMDLADHGAAIASWLDAAALGPVVLMGHSSGTQVAARAAQRADAVRAVALASPTIDPRVRGWIRLLAAWRLDDRREAPGLAEVNRPEWRRAGPRRLVHTVNTLLDDRLEDVVPELTVPVLVLHGQRDPMCSVRWAYQLAASAADGQLVPVPGAHTFVWDHPSAWSAPVHRLAAALA